MLAGVFALAPLVSLLPTVLYRVVSPWWLSLTPRVAVGEALKGVSGSCQACQAVKPRHRAWACNAHWTPVPDVPTQSVVVYKFAMPPVLHSKEVYDCVILCLGCQSRYLAAVPVRDKGLTAKLVAC